MSVAATLAPAMIDNCSVRMSGKFSGTADFHEFAGTSALGQVLINSA
jgi:hypothetical protein